MHTEQKQRIVSVTEGNYRVISGYFLFAVMLDWEMLTIYIIDTEGHFFQEVIGPMDEGMMEELVTELKS